MSAPRVSRRGLIGAASASFGGLMLAGCDRLGQAPPLSKFLGSAEGLTYRAQRLLLAGQPLAREFSVRDISPVFKSNGTSMPGSDVYKMWLGNSFADWRLGVGGMVRNPMTLSLADLRAMPARTQITRHDCVEGWSAIGQWRGAPLAHVLAMAGVLPGARYAVFYCADDLDDSLDGSGQYYESVDLVDAFHPQTILAYDLNGKALDPAHGAPLRLRVERQLGYKHAKYLMRIAMVSHLDDIKGGQGGYWEDRGYEWYAGI